ncbi:putative germin-like protein 2-1 [Selaginella moellendorffii]|uniref:putative germin-like protein 2-1 n=1 Tax=Selaginella moellendorffii TaxID=88036 RepID=UPI000D1C65BD|nr:putative germin-like protein 2-1 [Selaginella moellendorffii]|eukprot:XP_024516403.1 putative germin-like protein 2-1 [Selaginella moellendorffii]
MESKKSMLVVMILGAAAVNVFVSAADPDPLRDFEGSEDLSNFVLRDVFKNGVVSNGPGGVRAAINTTLFPGITSQGITYVHFNSVPCGVNLPHMHPRASELLTMISGGPLQVGFVDTAGVPRINLLNPGDITIFPRGMMHFEINVGTKPAFYISALNSQNPGTLKSGGALLMIPDRSVATALNVGLDMIQKLKANMLLYSFRLKLAPPAVCVPGQNITTKI